MMTWGKVNTLSWAKTDLCAVYNEGVKRKDIIMKTLRSSWNSDRIAACCQKPAKRPHIPRKRYLFAQYRGKEVSIMGAYGKKHFTIRFDSEIVSAIVKDDNLYVETMDQSTYIYNAITGLLVSANRLASYAEKKCGLAA